MYVRRVSNEGKGRSDLMWDVLNMLLTTGYRSNMISYILWVIFVPSVLTTGAVDFRMWIACGQT
jgi:hypothetical protein